MRMLAGLIAVMLSGTANAFAAAPMPPCGAPPVPDYPTTLDAPVIHSQTVTSWVPPACLGWNTAPDLLIAIAGRLHAAGADALLERFGAISRLRGVKYWSVSDRAWQTLVTDATATTDLAGRIRRADFSAGDMQPEAPLYSAERDNRAATAVTYRMRVLVRTPDRLVLSVANTSAVRAFFVTLFASGELQTTYFLDRLHGDEWGFYGLWGVATGLFTSGHDKSSINRAMALYRHFAGIPTDQEPPAAR